MASVLLLGAGASKGTLREFAPTSAEFGEYLQKNVPSWSIEYQFLAAAVKFLGNRIPNTSLEAWALDKVWSAIDTRVKLQQIWGLGLPGALFPYIVKGVQRNDWDPWGIAGFELACLVARVYGDNLEDKIKKAAEGNGSLKTELDKLKGGDCVISFNYDLLAERILDKLAKEWIRANRYYERIQRDNKILLNKPHGCLSWKGHFSEKECPVEILYGPMPERDIRPQVHPCLAAPVPFKSEIIDPTLQLNLAPNMFHLLVAQWRSAIEYLSEANKLVVMGYGFPSEDLYARYLFAEAAAKRDNEASLEVEVYEICRQRYDEVEKEIKKTFGPSRCHFTCKYKGKVEPAL